MNNKDDLDVLRMATYVINKSKRLNISITNLRLQKLLYFVAIEFVNEYGKYPFNELFEEWKLGAVIKTVYGEYMSNGSLPINRISKTLHFENGKFTFKEVPEAYLNNKEKDIVNSLILRFKNFSDFELVDLCIDHIKKLTPKMRHLIFKEDFK